MSRRQPAIGKLALRGTTAALILTAIFGISWDAAPPPVEAPRPSYDAHRIAFSGQSVPQLQLPDASARPVKSLLKVRGPLKYGQYVWNDAGVPAGPVWLRIDLTGQTLSVFRAGHEIGTAVILYGADEKPTPVGKYAVLEKREVNRSRTYDAPMPYTLRLTDDGIAIHGSDVRKSAATHGCVGVPLQFAARLFGIVNVGDDVILARGQPRPSPLVS